MDFLKKNYEKVLLGVVLLGLAVGAGFLPVMISSERASLQAMADELIRRTPKPLPELDLSRQTNLFARVAASSCLDLSTTNKVFNSVQWQKRPDNSLIKIQLGNEVGPEAVVVTKVTPLYLTITFDSVLKTDTDLRYALSVEKEAAPKPSGRTKRPIYSRLHDKTDTFVIQEVKGAPDNPTELVLDLNDTGERVTVAKDKPFKRVDGYMADLKYPPENKPWFNQRVGAPLRIAGEDYIIVAITKNEVVLSAKSNNKKTPRPYNPGP